MIHCLFGWLTFLELVCSIFFANFRFCWSTTLFCTWISLIQSLFSREYLFGLMEFYRIIPPEGKFTNSGNFYGCLDNLELRIRGVFSKQILQMEEHQAFRISYDELWSLKKWSKWNIELLKFRNICNDISSSASLGVACNKRINW